MSAEQLIFQAATAVHASAPLLADLWFEQQLNRPKVAELLRHAQRLNAAAQHLDRLAAGVPHPLETRG